MKAQCIAEKLQPSMELVRLTREQGISLAGPLPLEQVFCGEVHALREIEAHMASLGYRRTSLDDDSLGMTIDDVLGEAWVERTIPEMCELAERMGAEYDGWNVDVSSQTVK